MTPEEYQNRITKCLQVLHKKLPDVIDQNALNQKQLFRARVTQEGMNVDASGNESIFAPYNKYYAQKKENNTTPNRLLLTGDMLRKLNIVKRENIDGVYTATLGGSDQFAQDKLDYNGQRYGDILKPSNEEVRILQNAYAQTIADIINEELER